MDKQQMLGSVERYLFSFGKIGKKEKKILKAMSEVDRKNFMAENQDMAYVDTAMSIGEGQTISQPSTVARMLQLLELKQGDDVLEIGAGSGWNAGLIGFLVGDKKRHNKSSNKRGLDINKPPKVELNINIQPKADKFAEGNVLSLEIVNELAERAKENLKKFKNVEVKEKDFRKLKEKFDKIIFTAGILRGQEELIEDYARRHLEDNGALVCPYRAGPLIIFRKKGKKIEKEFTKEEYVFVPLVLN